MREVTVRLVFNRECLGYIKRPTASGRGVIFKMLRDREGRVLFLTSWWRERMTFAAKVLSRCGDLVGKIDWNPVVVGRTYTWKRAVVKAADDPRGRSRYALHEAFRPGDEVLIAAVVPDGIADTDFLELLRVIGAYRGISPYRSDTDKYGTFSVAAVLPARRGQQDDTELVDPPQRHAGGS
jgi:hypothetical protein